MAKKITVEQVDAQIAKVSASKSSKAAAGKFDLNKSYALVRPILVFATSFLGLFKPKWVPIIQQFIDGLDAFTKYKPIA